MTNTAVIIIGVFTAIGSAAAFIAAVVIMALRIQRFIAEEFKAHRKFVYLAFQKRDKAIRRLEFRAIKEWDGFQPGADPLEFSVSDEGNGAEH